MQTSLATFSNLTVLPLRRLIQHNSKEITHSFYFIFTPKKHKILKLITLLITINLILDMKMIYTTECFANI